MGLALALATTLFITSGMKAVVGKPRPNLLAICDADVDQLENFVVGGSGSDIESDAPALVTYEICRQTDLDLLNDAFFAFPSGHSSMSWAGLLYLSLWLCARFSVTIPYLGRHMPIPNKRTEDVDVVSYYHERRSAPPLWLVTIVLIPLGVALFICTSRYADHHHAGVDIFAGCIIGIISGYLSFRLYHLPVQRGYGMAWGPRDEEIAFIGDMPWHHRLTEQSTTDSRMHKHTRTSTSADEMLDYNQVRDSSQFPMQEIPQSGVDRV
jgi:membrane-associated phospholipid phosphatase